MKKLKYLNAAQRASLALGVFLLVYGLMLIADGISNASSFLKSSRHYKLLESNPFVFLDILSIAAKWIAGGLLLSSFVRRLPGKAITAAGLTIIAYQALNALIVYLIYFSYFLFYPIVSELFYSAIAVFGGYWRECYLREHPEIKRTSWFPFFREAQAQLAAAPDEEEEDTEEDEP